MAQKRALAAASAPVRGKGPGYQEIELRSPGDLKVYERNSRVHGAEQLEAIRRSIAEFGFTIPLLIDEQDMVLAGHARLEVALEMGLEQVPCLVAREWSPEQKRTYVIADNKLTERGGWDWEKLAQEMKDLQEAGMDLAFTGFEDFELEPLLEADWKKSLETSDEGDDDEPHQSTAGHAITVTEEQYEVIQRAVAQERSRSGQPKMSEGKALEKIAKAALTIPDEQQQR